MLENEGDMRNIMSNILVVVAILLAVYVIVEMILVLIGKIPPQHVAYPTEVALSVIMLGTGIAFLVLAVLFYLFSV